MRQSNRGFTMIEVLIVVAMIATIAAIAYPSYLDSVRRTNRADGLTTLMDTAQALERCNTTYGKYDNANCRIQCGDKITSPKGHYEVDVACDATTFTLTATPLSDAQKLDTKCANFSITETGKKSASGPDGDKCW